MTYRGPERAKTEATGQARGQEVQLHLMEAPPSSVTACLCPAPHLTPLSCLLRLGRRESHSPHRKSEKEFFLVEPRKFPSKTEGKNPIIDANNTLVPIHTLNLGVSKNSWMDASRASPAPEKHTKLPAKPVSQLMPEPRAAPGTAYRPVCTPPAD